MNRQTKGKLRVGAALLLPFALLGCRSIGNLLLCTHSTESSVPSPGGRYIAEVASEDCGARAHAIVVSIRPNRPFANKENLLVVSNTYPIKISWEGDNILVVACGKCYSPYIYSIQRQWKDVLVRYSLPPPALSSSK